MGTGKITARKRKHMKELIKDELLSHHPLSFWKSKFSRKLTKSPTNDGVNWWGAYEYLESCKFTTRLISGYNYSRRQMALKVAANCHTAKAHLMSIGSNGIPSDLRKLIFLNSARVMKGNLLAVAAIIKAIQIGIRTLALPNLLIKIAIDSDSLAELVRVLSRSEEGEILEYGGTNYISPVRKIESYRFIQFG